MECLTLLDKVRKRKEGGDWEGKDKEIKKIKKGITRRRRKKLK